MSSNHPRMTRENKTIEAMIGIYCHGQHGTRDELCFECDIFTIHASAARLSPPESGSVEHPAPVEGWRGR